MAKVGGDTQATLGLQVTTTTQPTGTPSWPPVPNNATLLVLPYLLESAISSTLASAWL